MDDEKYNKFFEEFRRFKEIQNKQKARGLNDFNILTTVRKYSDEVYLHSAMIGAFLNPKGLHYQNTLFLEKFIDIIGLSNWGLCLENIIVQVEYYDIDLYITDGTKHIIIENKIWADDQPCQITKYINIIIEKNKNDFLNVLENGTIDENLLRVIYLTARDKKVPAEHIVIDDNYIKFNGSAKRLSYCSNKTNTKLLVPNGLKIYKAKFKKIDYKKDIDNWLLLCLKEVKNIVNLSEAIRQYKNVVDKVNNNYEGDVMSLETFIKDNDDLYDCLSEIDNKLPKIKLNMEQQFWEDLLNKFKNKNVVFNPRIYKGKYPEIKITINEDISIFIRREWRSFYGIDIKENYQYKSEILKILSLEKNTWEYTNPKIDFHSYNNIFWNLGKKDSRKKIVNDIADEIYEIIEKIKDL
jgi:hypothetical protein